MDYTDEGFASNTEDVDWQSCKRYTDSCSRIKVMQQ